MSVKINVDTFLDCLQGTFNLEYLPLKVGETQHRLEFTCNDLGLYIYDLNLKATPAGPERAVYFRTTLGSNQVHQARFINYAKQKTDYTCKVGYCIAVFKYTLVLGYTDFAIF